MTAVRSKLVRLNALQSALKSETKWLNEVTRLNSNLIHSEHSNRFERRFSSYKSFRLASSPNSLSSLSSSRNSSRCFPNSKTSPPNSQTSPLNSRSERFRPSPIGSKQFSYLTRSTGCNLKAPLRSSKPATYPIFKRMFGQKVSLQQIENQPNGEQPTDKPPNIDQPNVDQLKVDQPSDQQPSGDQLNESRPKRRLERKPVQAGATMKDHLTTPNYQEAIATLNSLQSNRLEIQQRVIDPITLKAKVERTAAHLRYLGVEQNDLSAMNIVHISGTKGKGSTCAFVESILRRKGFKTGLFVSPHLISVRERIQLNGKPIEKELFARNFFHVYEQLKRYPGELNKRVDACGNETSVPFYFNFLTLMALYTFKQQGCNAIVLEVGIGGEFDCTNVVQRPAVVGVSSLGIDHVKLLGSSLKEIAWHKSGIFKPNVAAFTSDGQRAEALEVLRERAAERNCSLQICPSLDKYQLAENRQIRLGINGEVQKLNASLALQICNHFLQSREAGLAGHFAGLTVRNSGTEMRHADGFWLDDEYLDAIEECKWRGRYEVIPLKNKSTFYLDGAHTVESLTHCINWFRSECLDAQINDKRLFKILIFNCTGYRDYYQLLSPLLRSEKFDLICFTTNLKTVEELNNTNSDVFYAAVDPSNRDQFKEEVLKSLSFTGTVRHFDCLENCLKDIHVKNEANLLNNLQTKVLGCGSIHLIGGIMSLLNEKYA